MCRTIKEINPVNGGNATPSALTNLDNSKTVSLHRVGGIEKKQAAIAGP
jgi:hypothetical protein